MRALLPLALLALPVVAAPASAQDVACAVPAAVPAPAATPQELHELRRFATGDGVRVAVIDTGVAPHPELRRMHPGADYVADDALADCDSHGTVVAGIIAGSTLGIAPDAEIVSVRQTSAHYRGAEGDSVAGDLQTLTGAINNALDEGARVLNLSVVSCVEPGLAARIDTRGLEAALARAERDGAVVVAAAGNTGADCEPGFTVIPANYPSVLAVAAREDTHTIAGYSMPADLSAPGHVPLALASAGGGWADGTLTRDGSRPYAGTSFAAPVVSGAAALLMQRYPGIAPARVRELIHAAAEHGGGSVDPRDVISQLHPGQPEPRATLTISPQSDDTSHTAARFGTVALGVLALAALCSVAVSTSPSARRRG